MNALFNPRQIELLTAVCGDSTNAHLLQKAVSDTVTDQEVDTLCAIISDEMMMKGLKDTFEPNAYGLELEGLLNVVNRRRVTK